MVDKARIVGPGRAEVFERRYQAVCGYLAGERVSDLVAKWKVSAGEIYRLYQRAISPHPEDGRIWGFRALVPGVHVREYLRAATAPKIRKAKGGMSGMLSRLFRLYPSVRDRVVESYTKRKPGPHMKRLPLGRIFEIYIEACREAGVPADDYPFNVRNRGRRSLGKFLRSLYRSNAHAVVAAQGGKEASRVLRLGTEARFPRIVLLPYQRVMFDGHRIDAVFSIRVPHTDGGFIEVVANRPWLLIIIDVATRAILGWTLSLADEYTREDVLKCVRSAVEQTAPPVLKTPGLVFSKVGGMPGWVIPELQWAIWAELLYDNGKANLSEWVRHQIVSVLGGAVKPGVVAAPEQRGIIERLFETLESLSGHLMPSTTGSGPQDPRCEEPGAAAIKYAIRLDHLLDLLAVVIADYNGRPHESLGFRSPLEQLLYLVREEKITINRISAADRPKLSLLTMKLVVTVRGNIRKGRRPYVQFARERYSSDVLGKLPDLIGKQIEIVVDTEDVSKVRAFLLTGEELGLLIGLGRWGQTKHSMHTRRATNRLYNRKILHEADNPNAVHGLIHHLKEEAKTNKKAASALERVTRDADISLDALPPELEPMAEESAEQIELTKASLQRNAVLY